MATAAEERDFWRPRSSNPQMGGEIFVGDRDVPLREGADYPEASKGALEWPQALG